MDWKRNFDFSPNRKVPPQKGRRAANAHSSYNRSEVAVADDLLDSPPGSATSGPKSKSPVPVAPPRARRTGGWADDTTKSGKRRSAVNVIEQERFRDADTEVDSDDEIPVIPDLDDLQEEELGLQVADAPSMAVNRVAMYKELNSDLLKHSVFSTLDDINLQLLTKRLSMEADVKEADALRVCEAWMIYGRTRYQLQLETQRLFTKECLQSVPVMPMRARAASDLGYRVSLRYLKNFLVTDEIWTWEQVFTEVSSELNKEWESQTEVNNDKTSAMYLASGNTFTGLHYHFEIGITTIAGVIDSVYGVPWTILKNYAFLLQFRD